MKLLPVLIRPQLHAALNRWRRGPKSFSVFLRDLILLFFGGIMLVGIFVGTLYALQQVAQLASLAYLPPRVPLAMLLLFLFAMLTLSSTVVTLGAFFLSADNQLILASPTNRAVFFFSKVFSVFLNASWMPFIFLFPFLLAFGIHYGGTAAYYVSWLLILVPYFLIPTAIAVIVSHLTISVIAPHQTRALLGVFMVGMVVILIRAGTQIAAGLQGQRNIEEILNILTVLSLPDVLWLPPQWAALGFHALLEHQYEKAVAPIGLLWTTMTALMALAFLTFTTMFSRAYSRASNHRRYIPPIFQWGWLHGRCFRVLRHAMPVPSVALMLKDYRVLYRDMPQIIQLLLLLCIYVVYIYNLRIMSLVDLMESKDRSMWMAFFFIMNASMGSFITTAAATRLVFPSLSLEGRSFWVLQTAPISTGDILKNKFWTWLPPIGLLASLTFTAGNVALNASMSVIVGTFIVGWLVSAGIIALGLGIGGVFARFDWEHSAQLVASFGSFIFMVSSIFLIALNMIPLGICLFIRESGMMGEKMSEEGWMVIVGMSVLFIIVLNSLVIAISFRAGKRALRLQIES